MKGPKGRGDKVPVRQVRMGMTPANPGKMPRGPIAPKLGKRKANSLPKKGGY